MCVCVCAYQGVIGVEGADVVSGDLSLCQRSRHLRHNATFICEGVRGVRV